MTRQELGRLILEFVDQCHQTDGDKFNLAIVDTVLKTFGTWLTMYEPQISTTKHLTWPVLIKQKRLELSESQSEFGRRFNVSHATK